MKDRIGEKYGRLEIISFDKMVKRKPRGFRYYWNFLCDCGNTISVEYYAVKLGNTKSCGCLHKETSHLNGKANTVHGHTKRSGYSSEYISWTTMRQRCYKKENHNYKYYGEKGITVCDEWKDSFENFLADMGLKPDKTYTIDRIENSGNYCKENCKWSSKEEQNNNHSKNRKVIDIITNEEYSSIARAARAININMYTLHDQLTGKVKNKTNLKLKEKL